MKALGMIETYGCVAAVEALDSALKAANVSLLDMSRVKGGNVTVLIEGDVGAIKAAVAAAQASAASLGRVVAVHVIPRPAGDVGSMIETAASDKTLSFFRGKQEILEEPGQPEPPPQTDAPPQVKAEEPELESYTVEELRRMARALKDSRMTRRDIRFAKKQELIDEIMRHRKWET